MLYTFSGGPLDGRREEIPPERIKDAKYTHIEWGAYSSPFALAPALTVHQYLAVDDTLLWLEPKQLIK